MKTRRDLVLGVAGASLAAGAASAASSKEKPMAEAAKPTSKSGSQDGGIVDVHAHLIMPAYHGLLAKFGAPILGYGSASAAGLEPPPPPPEPSGPSAVLDTDDAIARRIALMDEAGVARQVLSAFRAPYFENEAHAVEAARMVNDIHERVVRKHPTRFSCFAALPLPHVEASLRELKRSMDELGMIGVGIQCFCLDRSVADDRFLPIYEELNRREAVVFFHPCVNGICSPFVVGWGLESTAGPVFEDTTVALHLIVKKIPQKFPKIKFIVPHLGGALPMLLNRLDNQLGLSVSGLTEKPSLTARRFWYDSVGHGSKAACTCALEAFGDEKILPGSDYPVLLPFESYRQTFNYIREIGLPASTIRRILYENARDVFGQDIDRAVPVTARQPA